MRNKIMFKSCVSTCTSRDLPRFLTYRLNSHTRLPQHASILQLQLPPVCFHTKSNPEETCLKCHITSSTAWPTVTKHELTHSERHCEDPEFSNFLAFVRRERPSQQQIDDALKPCSMNEQDVIDLADEDTKVLCSHREQVASYNAQLLRKFFPPLPDDAVCVAPCVHTGADSCTLVDLPDKVQAWAASANQHALQRAAPMLRVMITESAFPGAVTAVFGAMARIEELHEGGDSTCGIAAISVRLESDQSVHRLHRSAVHTMKMDGTAYQLSTFPLRPCTVISTPLATNAGKQPDLQSWLNSNERDFEALHEVAVGARAMVNKNISLAKGVSNGAPCVVRNVELNPDGSVKVITVQMESGGNIQKITRSSTHNHYHDGQQ